MKRFHDTNIWDRPWFRKLAPEEKCAVMFIKDKCDNAGVWIPDFEAADFFIAGKSVWETLPDRVNGNIHVLSNGKWWLPDFCAFQYGELKEGGKNPAHNSHIALLKKHGLWPLPDLSESPTRPLEESSEVSPKGLEDPQEKEKEKAPATEKATVTVTAEEKATDRAREMKCSKWPADSLEQATLISFQRRTPIFADSEKQLQAVPKLVGLASARGDPPGEVLPMMVDAFFALIDGDGTYDGDRDRKFWTGQAATPKQMLAVWDSLYAKVKRLYLEHQQDAATNDFMGSEEDDDDVSF